MHALLIGIDNYTGVTPLAGCVNDIDAIQRILIDKLKVAKEDIRRLVSPLEPERHETDVPSVPATRENLIRELRRLGDSDVQPEARIFIYYSGHGVTQQVEDRGVRAAHEGLVPVDAFFHDHVVQRILWDVELNALLARIAGRTRQVTFILDCCHSAGATRNLWNEPGDAVRALHIDSVVPAAALKFGGGRAAGRTRERGVTAGMQKTFSDCQVIAACQADEKALECKDEEGRRHGLLTQKLLTALRSVEERELPTLRWGQIWRHVVSSMAEKRSQHPMMFGSFARPVFGGPPEPGDIGYGVKPAGDGFGIDAGTLSGVTEGALVAVYASTPAVFPPLGSDEDRGARLGLLRVTQANRASAWARIEGTRFALVQGARARLVEAGAAARLAVGLKPVDGALKRQVESSALLRLAEAHETPAVSLERCADGSWALTDALHGTGTDPAEPFLIRIPESQRSCAAAMLEHYRRFSEPLRMAEHCTDLPGKLTLRLLDCTLAEKTEAGILTLANPQVPNLPELPLGPSGLYEFDLSVEQPPEFCIQLANNSEVPLKVALFNCGAEGRTQHLEAVTVASRQTHVFWFDGNLGSPFHFAPMDGHPICLEHFVVIGTTAYDTDLRYMDMDESATFAGVLANRVVSGPSATPLVRWTAARATVRIRSGG